MRKTKNDTITKLNFSNQHTERLILSLCMKGYEIFLEVAAQIHELDFLVDNHAELFSILKALSDAGIREFDLHTVVARAEGRGILTEIGGFKYIAAIRDIIVSIDNLQPLVNELLDRSYKYKLYRELSYLTRVVGESLKETEESNSFISLASVAEKRIVSLSTDVNKLDDATPLYTSIDERLEEFKERHTVVTGLSSEMDILDKRLAGFNNSCLYVVAARASQGKSALLMNWALSISINQNVPILYLDTEMTTAEIQSRAISCLTFKRSSDDMNFYSGVAEQKIRSGAYADFSSDLNSVNLAVDKLKQASYFHKYVPRFDISEIRRLAKKYKIKYGVGALFFDYIKMNDVLINVNETQYLGLLTTALKDLAGELEIPVISAAQLGRSAANVSFTTDSSVGESDRIVRYANVLMTLMPKTDKDLDGGRSKEEYGSHRLQILKNRGGISAYNGIDLLFTSSMLKFEQARRQLPSSIIEQKGVAGHKNGFHLS